MPRVNRPDEKHGMHNTKIYAVWENMIARCEVPTRRDYKHYGARGISVCKEWRNSFIQFHEDMKDGYNPDLRIDRRDNNGNYNKENCRWVDVRMSIANKRGFGKMLKGARLKPGSKKYHSSIDIQDKRYHIGMFDTELQAHEAYMKVVKEWYGI